MSEEIINAPSEYRIKIERIKGQNENGYEQTETVYEQRITDLDLPKLVTFINDK